jgi:acyl carrier protein
MAKLEEKIADTVMKEIARIFKKDEAALTRDTRFVEDLKAKSLNIVQLIAVLENEFETEIPYAEARRKKTIGEAIDLVIALRKG